MCKKLICLVTFVLVLSMIPTRSASAADPNLLGWWKLDEGSGTTAYDSSGNGNDGTLNGDPQWVAGKYGGALDFDGDDYVQLPDMGNHEAVTIELWWKLLDHIVDFAGFVTAPTSDAGMIHFKINWDGKTVTANKLDAGQVSTEEKTWEDWEDQWFHTAFTCDTKNDELKLYMDGELIDTDSAGTTPVNLTGHMIAREKEGRYFHGIIDDVRIYSRALSADEILSRNA